ncbi:MAG: hypothetical protein IKK61_08185 [Clostridia bacterium]|nr:hypothetical protein [Clostridia bacterium]
MTQYEEFMMQDDTVFVITFTDMSCEQLYFKGTPENIASYLLRWGFGAGITITDKRGRTILASNGSYIRECDDPKLMNEVYHWILNYRDETDPVIFEAYYLGEDNCGEVTLVPSTCITREDEETYTLWNIGLPLHVVQQFQSRTLHSDVPIHKLLGWIPKAGTGYNREVAMMVWHYSKIGMYCEPVADEFMKMFTDDKIVCRGSIDDIIDRLNPSRREITIMWSDLSQEMRQRIVDIFDEPYRYEMFPITTLYPPKFEP